MSHHPLEKCIKSPFYRQEPMTLHTTWKVGGPADIFISLACQEDLHEILRYSREKGTPLLVLGKGSNLLVMDRGIRGMVLAVSEHFTGTAVQGSTIKARAGELLSRLVRVSAEAGLSGLEFAAGIPGTVGGALLMNAGAHGGEMAQVFSRAGGITPAGEERVFESGDLDFSYRSTRMENQNTVITWVEFDLVRGNRGRIEEAIRKHIRTRRARQPGGATAGSVFKNPPQGPAGFFIEKAGLKGFRVGKARISERHANFILNTGGARAADILALMDKAADQVYQRFGITLEPEVRVIGE